MIPFFWGACPNIGFTINVELEIEFSNLLKLRSGVWIMLVEVKNYTKPNILLLGPTGSGKTYLLRNLAATWNKEVADECGKVLGCLVGVHLSSQVARFLGEPPIESTRVYRSMTCPGFDWRPLRQSRCWQLRSRWRWSAEWGDDCQYFGQPQPWACAKL